MKVVANHSNSLDEPVLLACLPRTFASQSLLTEYLLIGISKKPVFCFEKAEILFGGNSQQRHAPGIKNSKIP